MKIDSQDGVVTYLQIVSSVSGLTGCKSAEGFVLKHGQKFDPRPLPKGTKRGPIQQCFRNCANAAMDDPTLTYCEGYAIGVIPVLHAWCVDKDGKILELTWKKPGTEYFGIPFQTSFLKRQLCRSGYFGLIDAWKSNWPLLRGRFPKNEWYKKL